MHSIPREGPQGGLKLTAGQTVMGDLEHHTPPLPLSALRRTFFPPSANTVVSKQSQIEELDVVGHHQSKKRGSGIQNHEKKLCTASNHENGPEGSPMSR